MFRLPLLLTVLVLLLLSAADRLQGQIKPGDIKDYNGAMKAMQSTQPGDRAAGLMFLFVLGQEAKPASREVVGFLFDPNADVRSWAVKAIGMVNPPLAEPVVTLVQSQDYATRLKAMNQLAKLGDAAAPSIPALVAFLKDAQPVDKVNIVKAMSTVGNKDAKLGEVLADLALRDPNPVVRAAALLEIPKQQDPASGIEALAKVATSDGENRDRIAAIAALAQAGKGSPAAVKAMNDILRSISAPDVKSAARQALEKIQKK